VARLWPPHAFVHSDLTTLFGGDGVLARGMGALLREAPLPHTFLEGVVYTALLGRHGQLAFLHGQWRTHGWWYYFPLAFVLKYPPPFVLMGAAGLLSLLRFPTVPRARKIALSLPPLVLVGVAMSQSIDIGVRSVLPLAPFAALWGGAALAAARGSLARGFAVGAVALSALSGLACFPDFLAYFNPLLGGTRAADRWLVDSNLDWGQDLPALAAAVRRRGISELRLAYFGAGVPAHWGIPATDATRPGPGWYAISRTSLAGLWPPGDPFAWLRARTPVELVGGSIALFEIREEDLPPPLDADDAAMRQGLTALYDRGNAVAAVAAFQSVLVRHPGHYGARYQLAAALEAAGRRPEALAAWRSFLTLAEGSGDAAGVARAWEHISRLQAAR